MLDVHQMIHVPSRHIDQLGSWQRTERPSLEQLSNSRHGLGITVAGVVGPRDPASGVVSPAGSLKGNPIRVSKIDRPHQPVIDDLGDLAAMLQETDAAIKCCLMRQVKGDMIELYGRSSGTPAGLANRST